MSLGEGEFHFWTEPAIRHHVRSSNFGLYRSTGSWKAAEDDYSSSPLLPLDHYYSSPSPPSRSRVIEQGRRELMEMVRDMPESSFELSLKDIVDELQSSKESPKEDGSVGEGEDRKEEKKSIKKRKKAKPAGLGKEHRQVSRTSSMDSGTFMIKMFFPAFLTSRKRPPKGANGSKSKVSPRTSIDGPENREDCGSWSKKSIAAADQRIHGKHSGSKSSCRSRTSSCRDCMDESLPSCWPFGMVRGKMRRQRTCNF